MFHLLLPSPSLNVINVVSAMAAEFVKARASGPPGLGQPFFGDVQIGGHLAPSEVRRRRRNLRRADIGTIDTDLGDQSIPNSKGKHSHVVNQTVQTAR